MPIDNGGIACEPAPVCIACARPGRLLHTGLTDTLFGVPGVWSTRRCDPCDLGWIDPQPARDQIGRFYQRYWTHAPTDPAASAGAYRSVGVRRRVKAVLAHLLVWRSAAFRSDFLYLQGMKPGRLLDVGCGNGRFLAAATAEGWTAVGLDFDPQAVAAARTLPGVEAEVGDLLDQSFAGAAFDAIVLNNVIEHVPDPAATFAECARLLRPGGRLVMITPNLDALGHAVFGQDWRGLEPPRHLFLFSARALRRFARRAGFARTAICSSPGQARPDWPIIDASIKAAREAGRDPPAVDQRALLWKERLLDLIGVSRAEWVILVARR